MTVFDSHFHIIDTRFPLIENQGFMPDAFTCLDYLHRVRNLNVVGGAVVSGSFQWFDQSYLVDALQTLGENYVGVTQLPYNTADDDIIKLNTFGVRGIRFNVNRGGSEDISHLDYFARRVYELVHWHVELYVHSHALTEIAPVVEKLPAVSIDHLGLSKSGFSTLLPLVDKGVKVKATGFGRIDFDAGEALKTIYATNPDALMFGTDLPSTRAKRPFRFLDIELIYSIFEEKQAEKVLYKNAVDWYFS
ncbi:amidohydrolase family protein [Bacillus sp. Hm123]|uniref:amidohydrolase family protein n=1 Tax=Bacillus sp. Hm123 TaxID=3450745 RepID=UPI003F42395D